MVAYIFHLSVASLLDGGKFLNLAIISYIIRFVSDIGDPNFLNHSFLTFKRIGSPAAYKFLE